MTKADFVDYFAAKVGESKKRSGELVDAFLLSIQECLTKDDSVQFVGWGNFVVHKKPEKMGRNPKTGEQIKIPAKKVIKFKAGKKLADEIKK